MYATWSLLRLSTPSADVPWLPRSAVHAQAGQAAGERATMPVLDGTSWSVFAVWDDRDEACRAVPTGFDGLEKWWHVVLEPVSYRGDAMLAGGARPFDGLPRRGKIAGAAAVITMAGFGPDPARMEEFFERFSALGDDVEDAPGYRAALIQTPEDGAVLTFSAWQTLRDAVTWAYHRPDHAATVRRQEDHQLLARTGFLRCAVVHSAGTLGDDDPLAGLTGTPQHHSSTPEETR